MLKTSRIYLFQQTVPAGAIKVSATGAVYVGAYIVLEVFDKLQKYSYP